MFYIGLMSGTSVDAIDAVLVSSAASGGAKQLGVPGGVIVRATHRQPYPAALREAVQALIADPRTTLDALGALDCALGKAFAEAAQTLLVRSGFRPAEVQAIGSHGQTVRHRPDHALPFTLQLGNPSVIAELTGITTVADFRSRDMAAGGQGAPLVPAFHAAQFGSDQIDRVILNIGGIANITLLPADPRKPVIGFDTGPGSTLLDQWIQRHQGAAYDRDGLWAASGRVHDALLERLLADPYFAKLPPKSTGRERFHLGWLQQHLDTLGAPLAPQDVQATLLQLTTRSVARAVMQFCPLAREVLVCGGGHHNKALMTALGERLIGVSLQTTEHLGIAPDWVEAAAFAWLAQQTLLGRSGNIPSVTGARKPVILGGIYRA